MAEEHQSQAGARRRDGPVSARYVLPARANVSRKKALRVAVVVLALTAVATSGCGRTPLGGLRAHGATAAADTSRPEASAAEAVRRTSCTRGPSDPASLLLIDDYSLVQGVAAADGLVFTIVENYGASPAPFSHIATLTVATGEVTTTEIGEHFPMGLSAYSGGVLVPAGKVVVNGNAWSVYPSEVIRFVAGDQSWSLLTDPAEDASSSVGAAVGNDALQAFWLRADRGSGQQVIERWDPSGGTTQLVRSDGPMSGLQATHSTLYWCGVNPDGYSAFLSKPVAGGTPGVVWHATSSSPAESVALVGHDDRDLYFIHTTDAGGPGIMAVSQAGGAPRTVVSGVRPTTFATDGTHVYWWTLDDQSTLFRSPTAGGPIETVYHGRSLSAVALDECNVYWLVGNPYEIYYRAK